MSMGPPGFDSVFSIANSIRYLDSTAMHDRIINGARSGLFIRNITQLIYAF